MRLTGLFSKDRGALEQFAAGWRQCENETPMVHVRLWPIDEPLFAIALARTCNPAPQWAEDPSGSLAVLDGEVFGLAPDIGERRSGNAAAALLALYAARGPEGIAALNGGAGLLIFDAERRKLLLFRDRYGQVPVFYAERPEGFYWASDLPSLLQIGVPRTLDLYALDFFMAKGYVPAPWTFVREIRKVAPAHYYSRDENGPGEARRYWSITGRPKVSLSPDEASAHLGSLIEQAVGRRTMNGGPTGALLSSGVDSALLVACLAARTNAEVETFTFRYGAYAGRYNEFDLAHETARHLQIPHHALDCGPADVAQNIEQMVREYGEPFMWGIHTFNLHAVAATNTHTLLTGSGVGDWILRPIDEKVMLVRRLPAPALKLAHAPIPLLALVNPRLARHADTFLTWCKAETPFAAMSPVASIAYRRRIYRSSQLAENGQWAADELISTIRQEVAEESDYDQSIFLRQRLFIAECNLFWNNAWARARGLAVRHPYYDNDLQEFVMRLQWKSRNKDELRRYAATVLPREKAYAPKVYHTIPLEHWFRNSLCDFLHQHLSSERLDRQGLFRPSAIRQLIDEHTAGKANHTWRLLGALTVTVWIDAVLKGNALGKSVG
jgi:asparagine synthase (glutamine-hydrolysing)